jgi:broad specificity phosphatase PhoE
VNDIANSTIYLVRHGETTWNCVGRQQGHLDSPLTPKGIEQARAAGRTLRRVLPDLDTVSIETSPLGRARQTATLLCEELGLDESSLVIAPLLIEASFGAWQGLTHAEIDARYPGARQAREANKWHYVVPGGESYALVDARARRWLACRRHGQVTIAVTHEMLSRTMQGAYAALTQAETLGRSHPQDRIYWLHDGRIAELTWLSVEWFRRCRESAGAGGACAGR